MALDKAADLVLILSGGNALGAYQAGAYEALHDQGRLPKWVVGASIGAINAAIITGNPQDERVAKLRTFWRLAEQFGKSDPSAVRAPTARTRVVQQSAALQAVMMGRPGLFSPRLSSLWSAFPGIPSGNSLYDTSPLAGTLRQTVDPDRMNDGSVRLTVTAVDSQTGEDVVFDSTKERITLEHLRASAAFPVAYPPVEIEGRMLVDPGLSANMPLQPVLAQPPQRDMLCIAIDLFSPDGPQPRSVGDAAQRAQDLLFANQTRHTINALSALYEMRRVAVKATPKLPADGKDGKARKPRRDPAADAGNVTLLHVIYSAPERESAAKMLDYSSQSIQARWMAGHRDMKAALDHLEIEPANQSVSGFRAFRFTGQELQPY